MTAALIILKPRQIEVKTGNGSKSKRSVEVEQQTR